jgi:uncharacterized membrane protein HdeD (DUF308 family)
MTGWARDRGAAENTPRLDMLTQPTGWPMAVRGLLAILFGVIALANPQAAAFGLVVVFAAWAFVDGAFAFFVAARRGREGMRWGWFVFEGLVSVAAGIVALAAPRLTILALTFLVALRAIILGVITASAAITSRETPHRWLYGLTGVVSALFGILLLSEPFVGALAILWAIGVYAIIFGVMMVAVGLRVHFRGEGREPSRDVSSREGWTARPPTPVHG